MTLADYHDALAVLEAHVRAEFPALRVPPAADWGLSRADWCRAERTYSAPLYLRHLHQFWQRRRGGGGAWRLIQDDAGGVTVYGGPRRGWQLCAYDKEAETRRQVRRGGAAGDSAIAAACGTVRVELRLTTQMLKRTLGVAHPTVAALTAYLEAHGARCLDEKWAAATALWRPAPEDESRARLKARYGERAARNLMAIVYGVNALGVEAYRAQFPASTWRRHVQRAAGRGRGVRR